MKRTKIISGMLIATSAVIAFAATVQKASVEITKDQPQLVTVWDGKDLVAEIKIRKPGTLKLEAADIAWRAVPRGKVYNLTKNSKLELFVQDRSVFELSGDSMTVQPTDKEIKPK